MAIRYRVDPFRWSTDCNELFFKQSYSTHQSESSVFFSPNHGNHVHQEFEKPNARSAVMESSFRVECRNSEVHLRRNRCPQQSVDLSSSSSEEVAQVVRRKPKKRPKRRPNLPSVIPNYLHHSRPLVRFFLP